MTPPETHPWRQGYKQRRLAPKRVVVCAGCGAKLERQGFNGKQYRCSECKAARKRAAATARYNKLNGKDPTK